MGRISGLSSRFTFTTPTVASRRPPVARISAHQAAPLARRRAFCRKRPSHLLTAAQSACDILPHSSRHPAPPKGAPHHAQAHPQLAGSPGRGPRDTHRIAAQLFLGGPGPGLTRRGRLRRPTGRPPRRPSRPPRHPPPGPPHHPRHPRAGHGLLNHDLPPRRRLRPAGRPSTCPPPTGRQPAARLRQRHHQLQHERSRLRSPQPRLCAPSRLRRQPRGQQLRQPGMAAGRVSRGRHRPWPRPQRVPRSRGRQLPAGRDRSQQPLLVQRHHLRPLHRRRPQLQPGTGAGPRGSSAALPLGSRRHPPRRPAAPWLLHAQQHRPRSRPGLLQHVHGHLRPRHLRPGPMPHAQQRAVRPRRLAGLGRCRLQPAHA
jgi:hypothetical protein